MSLTSNIKERTAIGKFLLEIVETPQLPETCSLEPIVEHLNDREGIIGTAFDYMVRMSLASIEGKQFEPKIAERALNRYLSKQDPNECDYFPEPSPAFEQNDCGCNFCFHEPYFLSMKDSLPYFIQSDDVVWMARLSLSFARLDNYFRCGKWDDYWGAKSTDDEEDVPELIELHDLWKDNFDFASDKWGLMELNPSFASSRRVGGADADVIAGTEIIDWKVVNKPRRELKRYLAQMIGYCLLSNLDGKPLETCTLYFARHGVKYSIPFTEIMNMTMKDAVKRFNELTSE